MLWIPKMPQALISLLKLGTAGKISPNSRNGGSSHPSSPSCVHSWTCEALGLLRPIFTAGIFLLPEEGKSTHLRTWGLGPPCCQQTIPSQGDLQGEHDGGSAEGPGWCWHTGGHPEPTGSASASSSSSAQAEKRLGWLWGWEQGAQRGTQAWGQGKAAESSCAINTTALLPLTCLQCD